MDSMPQSLRFQKQATPLKDVLAKFIEPGPDALAKRYETTNKISQLWTQLLPPVLAEHCRIVEFSQGQITVEADSPSFLYEMRISSQQLIQYLRQGCPSAKIRAIKVILAR
jgi:hypothetical protein